MAFFRQHENYPRFPWQTEANKLDFDGIERIRCLKFVPILTESGCCGESLKNLNDEIRLDILLEINVSGIAE